MFPTLDLKSVRFNDPEELWLLAAPALLLVLWLWRLNRHRRDARRFRVHRRLPMRERLPHFGELLFWLCLILASAATIVAAARPVATASMLRTGGVDLILLQDGSTSMRVTDVVGDRWQRSIRFIRVLAEGLQWRNDRVAMALFARIATPQIRLTSDPNTLFFFLDHLDRESPFRLEDDTSWDTNIELGITWGLRLLAKDEELHGKSPNAKVFLLVSDGQNWSGEARKAVANAQSRNVPIFVVGVGTTGGGLIPEPALKPGQKAPVPPPERIRSVLDRASLKLIADAGDGQYMELDRDADRDIANRIIDAARRRAQSTGGEGVQELYWQCLLAAACFLGLSVVALREQPALWLQTAGAGTALLVVWALTR